MSAKGGATKGNSAVNQWVICFISGFMSYITFVSCSWYTWENKSLIIILSNRGKHGKGTTHGGT